MRLIKIQNLTTAFETISMKDEKTFDEFNSRLSDIINSSFNLGEPIPNQKVVKKILRSKRFHLKLVAIEEHTNLNELFVEELVGNLRTFEANHCSNKKFKGIALMSSKNDDDGPNDGSDDNELEVVFVNKFKKFPRKNKGNLNKDFQKNKVYKKFEKKTLFVVLYLKSLVMLLLNVLIGN